MNESASTEPKIDLRETVYDATSSFSNLGYAVTSVATEIYACRELSWILFLRDLKAQFRQSLLGYLWLFLPPILTTAVWLYLNSQKVVGVSETSIPYPLFVMSGTLVWQSFVRCIQSPMASVAAGRVVFMKLKVPPSAFIIAGCLRAFFDFVLYAIVLTPVLIYYQVTPGWSILLLPAVIFSLFALGTAIGILFAPLSVLYTDIQQAAPLVLGFAMYLTPVVFPLPQEGNAALLMSWNPVTPIIISFRDLVTTGSTSYVLSAVATLAVSIPTIWISLLGIKIVMPHLVARMGM